MGSEYELVVRQEPKQARMCGVGGECLIPMYAIYTTSPSNMHHRHVYAPTYAHLDAVVGGPWCGGSALAVGGCLVPRQITPSVQFSVPHSVSSADTGY